MVKCKGEHVPWYGSDDLRAKIEQPSCRQYKPGDFLAFRPLNWDEIIDKDDDNENGADPGAPSGGRSRPGAGNDNDDSEGEENRLGGEKGTRNRQGTKDGKGKGKATEDRKGKGKGKGNRNGKGKGIVEQTPGEHDISRTVALRLQKNMSEVESVVLAKIPGYPASVRVGTYPNALVRVRNSQVTEPTPSWGVCYPERT
jgi:hypothetical protein